MVIAMEALRSLWLSSCAPAVGARAKAKTHPSMSAPQRSVDGNILFLPNGGHRERPGEKYSGILRIAIRGSVTCFVLHRETQGERPLPFTAEARTRTTARNSENSKANRIETMKGPAE